MRPLEKVAGGSSITFGSFSELVGHLKAKIQEGNKPRIAIEMPKWSKFIAFFVRELQEFTNGTYRPLPAGYLYDCSLPDGFFTPNGEGSYHIPNYPVNVGKQDFEQGRIYVIDPSTNLGIYIKFQSESGRTKAHEFWRQVNPELATPPDLPN